MTREEVVKELINHCACLTPSAHDALNIAIKDLSSNMHVDNYMTRKELAINVFEIVRKYSMKKDIEIWQAIAETDDKSLLSEYETLKNRS